MLEYSVKEIYYINGPDNLPPPLSKDDEDQKKVGKECIILGLFSCIIAVIIGMLVIS